jgi:hypothetical protein
LRVVHTLSTALLLFVALINLVPVSGVLSANRLTALYGIAFVGSDLLILMRHRAVLFGIVGGVLVVAAFHAPLRGLALAVGLTSMLSFVLIAWLEGELNAQLRRVVIVDLVAIIALVASAVIDRFAGEA